MKRWWEKLLVLLFKQHGWTTVVLCGVGIAVGSLAGVWVRQVRTAAWQPQLERWSQLSPQQRSTLLRRWRRWEKMSPDEQRHWLQFHTQLQQHPQSHQLQQALEQFHTWLAQVPLSVQWELTQADLPVEKRLELLQQRYQDWLSYKRLSPAEQEALKRWWWEQLDQHGLLPPAAGLRTRGGEPSLGRLLAVLRRRGPAMGELRRFLDQLPPEAFQQLVRRLPVEYQQQWTLVPQVDQRRKIVFHWTLRTLSQMRFHRSRPWRHRDMQDRLVRFFEQLPAATKQQLLELPPSVFWQQLARRYEEAHPPRSSGPSRPRPPGRRAPTR